MAPLRTSSITAAAIVIGTILGGFCGHAPAQELIRTSQSGADERWAEPSAFRLDISSGAQTELKPETGGMTSPSWSPDGSRLVFCGGVASGFGLFVSDADGSDPVMIAGDGTASQAAWSPDGEWIAFTGLWRGGEPGLFLVRPDGSDLVRISHGMSPSWSPDGRRLAFFDATTSPLRIAVHELDTGRSTHVADFGPFPLPWGELVFAHDATALYYTKTVRGAGGRFSAEVRRVTMRDGGDVAVAEGSATRLLGASPDRHTLALLRADPDREHAAVITLLDVTTGAERALFSTRGPTGLSVLGSRTIANFAWAPESPLVAFELSVPGKPGARSGVVLADLERGLASPPIGGTVQYATGFAWRP